jgi:signal transduction histidine kinase/CheY-like chemotaxis protein
MRSMSLRASLVVLILATLLPLAILAAITGGLLVSQERKTFRDGAEQRTLAVLTALDNELKASMTTIRAFATLPAFDEDDLETIRERASRILATQPDWDNINVALPSGQQVVNLAAPPGAPLPNTAAIDEGWLAIAAGTDPVVSDMVLGPVTKRWDFAVRMPVVRGGKVKYVISAVVKPASIASVIKAQALPRDWVGVVVDRNGRIVARNADADASVGKLASESLRGALAAASSGWFRGATIEGSEVYTPYRRSAATGWAFAMGIPSQAVEAVEKRALASYLAWLLVALGLALALGILFSRRIARPIAALVAATKGVPLGEDPRLLAGDAPSEIRTLESALQAAARAVRERQALVEREQGALRAADRRKDDFLAMLSHELRNPLAALMAATHVLKTGDPAQGAAVKAREVIERQTRHMSRLIGDLLDIGRINAGKLGLERERMDLGAAVSRLVNDWRESARFDRHRVSCSAKPTWIDADRARIEQIVANLLDNALKFTPAGKVIAISVADEDGTAVLRVSDEGEGLSPDSRGTLFELFVQGDNAAERGGMGVGLALVRRLVELHGGTVEAASEGPGRGTTFIVRLSTSLSQNAQPASPSGGRPASHRVLVVEDNEDARRMLEAALTLNGYHVHTASDGVSGLALAAESRPDVVLIDIGLPGLDGYEVARRIRAVPGGRRVGLVAVTGYGQPEDRQRAFEAGFDAHLVKPVSADRLKQIITGLA